MGDVGLGKEFHMMTSEQNRWIPPLLEAGMADVGTTTPVPWLGSILMRLPKAGQHAKAWLEFVGSQVKERVEKQVERADVWSCTLTHPITKKADMDQKRYRFSRIL